LSKILVISRYFPPLSSAGGSIRLVKLMKYTSRQGWEFIVLTQDPHKTVIPEKELCGFLLDEVPEKIEIVRVAAPFTGNSFWQKIFHFIFKNSSLPWGIAVAKHGVKVIKRSSPDLIFVNSPPFTNVAIGMMLSIWTHIPFVVDLKDDWVGSAAFVNKGRFRQQLEKWIERAVFKQASALITPTPLSYESVKKRYSGSIIERKVHYIPNGEDLEEYKGIWEQKRNPVSGRFRIISAAAGYKPGYRDLTPLLQALELFLYRSTLAREQTELEFIGEEPDDVYKNMIEKMFAHTHVIYKEPLARPEFISALSSADLFFLVQPKNNFTAISGTLYEYWAVGIAPVLLFSEKGASSELVIQNNFGRHFLFDQVKDASFYIEEVYQFKLAGTPIEIDLSGIDFYDRKANAYKMTQLWDDVISPQRSI